MRRIALSVTAALALAGGACAPQAKAPDPSAAPVHGKARAPVAIDAELADGAARVTVRFAIPASDVRVEVRGTEGLEVTSPATPVEGAAYAAGAAASLDVAFRAGPGRSLLSIAVSGSFAGGGRSGTVTTFPIGEPTPEQRKATGTVIDAGGERIKVVPGQ